jgi:hypothetical protein
VKLMDDACMGRHCGGNWLHFVGHPFVGHDMEGSVDIEGVF